MGLVDGDARQLLLAVDRLQVPAELLVQAVLGRHVEQAGSRVAAAQVLHDALALLRRAVAVERGHGDLGLLHLVDLAPHEGQERRDAYRDAVVDHRGELVAEALAEGGGGLDEDIVACQTG